jgi:hypothetical protein
MERDSTEQGGGKTSLYTIRLVCAGAFMSFFVATDLFLNFFCSFWPVLFYLGAAALGVWQAETLYRRFSFKTAGATFVRRLGIALAVFSAVGLVILFTTPVNWHSKCAWRHCGRALGVGLLESPFPVGAPTCGAWHKCANESQLSQYDYDELVSRMEAQGCAAP